MICYHLFQTAIGDAGFALTQKGVCRVILPGMKSAKIQELLVKAYPEPMAGGFPPSLLAKRFIEQAQAYFQGCRVVFTLPLDLAGASDFDRKIYRALRKVTYGQKRSYGWLAEKAGIPGGARAAGSALARNPVPLLVPCHRIIRTDGGWGGFSAAQGVNLKKWMLELEARSA